MSETIETRRKRLLHRSRYRGSRESDLLLGGFAQAHLRDFTPAELDDWERLLDEADGDVLAWVMRQRPVPARHDTALMRRLMDFRA